MPIRHLLRLTLFPLTTDFRFLFGQQDIDLRAMAHVPVHPFVPSVPQHQLSCGPSASVFCLPDSGHAVDTDSRIPFHLITGLPVAPFLAHVPLQSLDPNLSHYLTPQFVTAGPVHVPHCSQPELVDLTSDESPPGSATRRTVAPDAETMKQVLDRQPAISPYEPNDVTFIPISGPESPVVVCDETEVVDDWLEKALVQNSPPVRLGANSRMRSEQTTTPNSQMGSSVSHTSSRKRRSRSPSSPKTKRRKSDNGQYEYKSIRIIDQRRIRPSIRRSSLKSQSSSSGSRRVLKRHEARKVQTVRISSSDVTTAPDAADEPLLPDDMKEAPIEVLMAHVERIKNKLLALSEAEKQGTATPSPTPTEPIVQKVGDTIDKRTEDEDDEDIGELRRIAILSMKAKALEESAAVVAGPHNQTMVTHPPQNHVPVEEEEEDIDALRQQLLFSLTQNRQQKQAESSAPLNQVPLQSGPKSALKSASRTLVTTSGAAGPSPAAPRLVINFNDSDSDSDECQDKGKEPPGLTSLLAAARIQSNQAQEEIPLGIRKLTLDQQREYMRLKEEIAKREKKVDTATTQLDASEKKYRLLAQSIREKESKVATIKESVAKKKTQYLKADAHAKKMAELLAAAQKTAEQTLNEFKRLTIEQTQTQQALVAESAEARILDQECLRLGKEVQGTSYVQPSKRRANPPAVRSRDKIVEEKNRLMARKSAILSLVQEKRISGQSPVVRRKPMHSSIRLPALHALKKSNIVKNGRENKDPQILKTKKKKKVVSKEENFEKSVALLFDRHLKETAKEQASGEAAIDYLPERPEIIVPHTDCVLRGMSSFRLSPAFTKIENLSVISDTYCNAVDPFRVICYFDLHGVCKDPKCEMQHKGDYLLKEKEKLVDILSYKPSLAGVTDSTSVDNQTAEEKMFDFVERYAASQPSLSADAIAKQLMKLIRHSRDPETTASRCLRPEHEYKPSLEVRKFKYAFNGELNSDGTEVSHDASDNNDDED